VARLEAEDAGGSGNLINELEPMGAFEAFPAEMRL